MTEISDTPHDASTNPAAPVEPIEEFGDVDWVEIDCAEYEQVIERIGYRLDFAADAPKEQRAKLATHISYTDPEGHRRSKTVWGNDTHGLVLWWSGYLGRYDGEGGRLKPQCKHWIGRHAMELAGLRAIGSETEATR